MDNWHRITIDTRLRLLSYRIWENELPNIWKFYEILYISPNALNIVNNIRTFFSFFFFGQVNDHFICHQLFEGNIFIRQWYNVIPQDNSQNFYCCSFQKKKQITLKSYRKRVLWLCCYPSLVEISDTLICSFPHVTSKSPGHLGLHFWLTAEQCINIWISRAMTFEGFHFS